MPKRIVEGPDGKQFVFPDDMPMAEINKVMRERYGTKARNETVQDYLARVVREDEATEARRRDIDRQASQVGLTARGQAAERMGVDSPLEMAFAGPALDLAQQSGAAEIYRKEGTVLPDEAAGLSAANAAGLWIPGAVNREFGMRVAEGRRQEPGAAIVGDVAGGLGPTELLAGGALSGVRALGGMMRGRRASAGAPEMEIPSVTISPEERAMLTGGEPKGRSQVVAAQRRPSTASDPEYMAARKQAFLTPEEIAMLLDTPDDIKPAGFDVTKPSVRKRSYGTETFWDERLSPDQNKALEMRRNGYTPRQIADEMDTSEDVIYHHFMAAKRKGVELGPMPKDNTTLDILALKEKGVQPREIAERLGLPRNQVNVMLTQARNRIRKTGAELPEWLKAGKGGRPMGAATGNAAENAFSAFAMSGAGSLAGGEYDINADGVIDDTDRIIGSGLGLVAFASPAGWRKVAEFGARVRGAK